MPVERSELEDLKTGIFARLNPLSERVSLMEQALATHKEWEEEKFSHNGTAHIEMRDDTSELEKQIEKARPAIEWVMGIRRAWGRILIALIITGLITVGSALLKVYALWKSLPPIGGGP